MYLNIRVSQLSLKPLKFNIKVLYMKLLSENCRMELKKHRKIMLRRNSKPNPKKYIPMPFKLRSYAHSELLFFQFFLLHNWKGKSKPSLIPYTCLTISCSLNSLLSGVSSLSLSFCCCNSKYTKREKLVSLSLLFFWVSPMFFVSHNPYLPLCCFCFS